MTTPTNDRDVALQQSVRFTTATGYNAVLLALSTPNLIITSDAQGQLVGPTTPVTAKLFVGAIEVTSGVVYTITPLVDGLSASIGTTGVVTLGSLTSWTSQSAVFSVTATYNQRTYTQQLSVTKLKSGSSFYALNIRVYKQAANIPQAPSGGSYTFNGNVFVPPVGWSMELPTTTTTPTWASEYLFTTTDAGTVIPGPVSLTNADPYFSNVSLLLHMVGANGSTTFTDSGPLSKTPSSVSIANISTVRSKWGVSSGDFVAFGSEVNYSSSSDFDLPGDFTLETWVYQTVSTPGYTQCMAIRRVYDSSGTGTWRWFTGGFQNLGTLQQPVVYTLPMNRWVHVAVTRFGSTMRAYIDGELVSTGTDTTNFSNNHQLRIGRDSDQQSSRALGGYMADFRITKGIDRYTQGATVPSAEFLTNEGDPYFNKVVLLLTGASLVDASDASTPISVSGSTSMSSTQKKYATSSYLFNGSGDYITANSVALNLSGVDYTVDGWFWRVGTATGDRCIFSNYAGQTFARLYVRVTTSGTLLVGEQDANGTNTIDTAGGVVLPDTWNHFAIVKSGTSLRGFLNGVLVASTTSPIRNNFSNIGKLGVLAEPGAYEYPWIGYLEGIRVTKGVARYTAQSLAFVPTQSVPTDTSDPYYNNTSLLLKLDGAENSTVFTDSSPRPKFASRSGDARIYGGVLRNGGRSLYLDGSGDYLTFPPDQDFIFGTADYTIEFWIWAAAGMPSGNCAIYSNRDSYPGNGGLAVEAVGVSASNSFRIWVGYGDLVHGLNGTKLLPVNQWIHYAVTREAGVLRSWVNGEMTEEQPDAGNLSYNGIPTIGKLGWQPAVFNGYLDDFRITKGIARYTPRFNVPTAPYPTEQGVSVDTSLLLRTSLAGDAFADLSVNSAPVYSVIGMLPSTAQQLFSYPSIYFNGTSHFLRLDNSAKFDLAASDFTIECHFYCTSMPANYAGLVGKSRQVADYGEYSLGFTSTGVLQFAASTEGEQTTGWNLGAFASAPGIVTTNRWHHAAVVRSGSSFLVYLNGSLVASGFSTAAITTGTSMLTIGANKDGGSFKFNGYIDSVRIIKGSAAYPKFTPPLAEFPDASTGDVYQGNNSLLLRFDGANQSTTFTDSSQYNHGIVRGGDTKISTTEFRAGTSSAYFDGVGDYLEVTDSSQLDLPGDFTIEMFIYPTTTGVARGLINHRRLDTSAQGTWGFDLNAANQIRFANWSPNIVYDQGGTVLPNQWSHVAATRFNGNIKLWVNGDQVASWTDSTDFTNNYPMFIGFERASGANTPAAALDFFTGYMDSVRITKGVARYTSNFVVPSGEFLAAASGGWPTPTKFVQDGASGGSVLTLGYTAQAFTFDSGGTASPANQTITFTATPSGTLTGTANFVATLYSSTGTSLGTVVLGGTGNQRTLTSAQFASAQSCVVIASLGGYADQVTVVRLKDGSNAITGQLTNESSVVAASSTGFVADFSNSGGVFKVWDGIVDKTGNGPVYSQASAPTGGLGITINPSTGIYTINQLTTDRGSVLLQAVYAGVTIQKQFDIAKSRTGTTGVDAITGLLTNESTTVPATSQGTVADFTQAGGVFKVWDGLVEKTTLGPVYSVVGTPSGGLDITIDPITGVYQVNALTSDRGSATLQAIYLGVTLQKSYDISKGKAGVDGEDAPTVVGIYLDKDAVTLPADADGYVSSYSAAACWVTVTEDNVDVTNTWTLTINATPGVTASITNGRVQVTSMLGNSGSVTISATKTNLPSQVKVFTLTKARSSGSTPLGAVVAEQEYNDSAFAYSGTATAGIRICTDGTFKNRNDSTGNYDVVGVWYTSPGANVGANYNVRFNVTGTSGGTFTGVDGTWMLLDSDKTITLSWQGPGTVYATGFVQFAHISAPLTVVGGGAFTLDAEAGTV